MAEKSGAERRAEQDEIRRAMKDRLKKLDLVWTGGFGRPTTGNMDDDSADKVLDAFKDQEVELAYKD